MTKFKKQYRIMVDSSLNKLETRVYFEINHEGWIPLGGAFTSGGGWYQTMWLPEPFWKDKPEVLNENIAGDKFDANWEKKPTRLVEREEEEPEIFRDD